MTSYLVYSLADQRQYNGLFVAPDQGQKQGLKSYDKYPQLQYCNFKKEYCRVNDAFIGHIIRLITRDFERRVSHSAKALLK